MGTRCSIRFAFDAPCDEGHVRAVLDALDRAVTENWREDAHVWSGPVPLRPVAVDAWLVEAPPPAPREGGAPSESRAWEDKWPFQFDFSPMSTHPAELYLSADKWGGLRVGVYIWLIGLNPDDAEASHRYYNRHIGFDELEAEADEAGRRHLSEFSYFAGQAIGEWIVARRAQWAEWGRGVFDFELIARRHWDHLKLRLSEALPVERWDTYDPAGSHSGIGPWTPPAGAADEGA